MRRSNRVRVRVRRSGGLSSEYIYIYYPNNRVRVRIRGGDSPPSRSLDQVHLWLHQVAEQSVHVSTHERWLFAVSALCIIQKVIDDMPCMDTLILIA